MSMQESLAILSPFSTAAREQIDSKALELLKGKLRQELKEEDFAQPLRANAHRLIFQE